MVWINIYSWLLLGIFLFCGPERIFCQLQSNRYPIHFCMKCQYYPFTYFTFQKANTLGSPVSALFWIVFPSLNPENTNTPLWSVLPALALLVLGSVKNTLSLLPRCLRSFQVIWKWWENHERNKMKLIRYLSIQVWYGDHLHPVSLHFPPRTIDLPLWYVLCIHTETSVFATVIIIPLAIYCKLCFSLPLCK